jgi:hypothetical protein
MEPVLSRAGSHPEPRCSGSVLIAGVIWINVGSLILLVTLSCAVHALDLCPPEQDAAFVWAAVCLGLLLGLYGGLAFLTAGFQTLRGTAPDTRSNGLGSLVVGMGLAASLFCAGAAPLVEFSNFLLGPTSMFRSPETRFLFLLFTAVGTGLALMLAGLLALFGRAKYEAWQDARQLKVAPSRWRWLRRGMVAITVAALLLMVFLAIPRAQHEISTEQALEKLGGRADEVEAVRVIEKLGGRVAFDNKQSSKPVIFVVLARSKNLDPALKKLKELKSLSVLDLRRSSVTDADLTQLKDIKSLQVLHLGDTEVSDAGLKELTELKSLRTLGLKNTRVTDAGVQDLQAALPELKINR